MLGRREKGGKLRDWREESTRTIDPSWTIRVLLDSLWDEIIPLIC